MSFTNEIIVIVLMLAFNAVFAAYEIALTSISKARMSALAQNGRKGIRAAQYMKDKMERSLAVIQVGITLAGAIAAATGGAGVEESLSPILAHALGIKESWADALALTIFVIPLSGFTIAFGELIPKMVGLNYQEWVLLRISPIMMALSVPLYPIIVIFEGMVKAVMRVAGARKSQSPEAERVLGLLEVRAAATLARSSRIIGALEEKIVHGAVQMSVRTVRDVMLPVGDIITIPKTASLTEALITAHNHMHTRFPVCESPDKPSDIIGYLNFKDIVAALKMNPDDPSTRGILRPIARMDQSTTLAHALDQLTHSREHIVLVTGAKREVLGMLTLEDVIEDLVGDIEDEYDRLPTHVSALSAGWLMGSGLAMPQVFATLGRPWTEPAAARTPTLAEWLELRHPGPYNGGEIIQTDGMEILVRKTRRRRPYEAIVRLLPAAPSAS